MKEIIITLTVVVTIATFITVGTDRTEEIMLSGDSYVDCVLSEYGMTPDYLYAVNGVYPECN